MNKKKTVKNPKQAIEIIIEHAMQEKETNPFLKNTNIRALKVLLKSEYKEREVSVKNFEDFNEVLQTLFKELDQEMKLAKLVGHFSKLFSKGRKKGKLQQKLSDNREILVLIGSLSSVLALIIPFVIKNCSLNEQLLSYPLSFVSGMDNNSKSISRWKK